MTKKKKPTRAWAKNWHRIQIVGKNAEYEKFEDSVMMDDDDDDTERSAGSLKCLLILVIAVPVLMVIQGRSQRFYNEPIDSTNRYEPKNFQNRRLREVLFKNEDTNMSQTERCLIPYLDPYDKSIKKFVTPPKPIDCGRKPQLSYVNKTKEGYVLHINQDVVDEYNHPEHALSCCYSTLRRYTLPPAEHYSKYADLHYNVSSCHFFQKEILLKKDEEFIIVECYCVDRLGISRSFVYRQMHSMVTMKQNVLERIKKRTPSDEGLNVLIVVYDSMSRLNLLRTMPKTVSLLENMGFITFSSLNKVGENTFPNAVAMMSGLSMTDLQSSCWKHGVQLDDCPFLWKEFQRFGYVTDFSDEGACLGSRTYGGTFVKQPTDYYQRPLFIAGEDYRLTRYSYGLPLCHGSMKTTDQLYEYLMYYITNFSDYFHFSVTWFSNFSHDDLNEPAAMDSRTVQFFQDLSSHNVYNNTLVVFASDHGRRYGPIRERKIGWFEERLPYLYLSLPEWFKEKYPNKFKNLISNKNKLISTHNIYVTLKDILYTGNNLTLPEANVSASCPKCRSLFSEDVGGTSCEDLGIPLQFCACLHFEETPVTDIDVRAAKFAVEEVKKIINRKAKSDQCATLRLHAVINAGLIQRTRKQHHKQTWQDRLVTFETQPGGARLQALLKYNTIVDTFSRIGSVMRINAYREQSSCVDDPELKLYCLCIYP